MFQNSVNFNKILRRLLRKSSHSDKSSPSSREHSICGSTTSQFGSVVQVAWRLSCQWGNWCQLRQLRVPWLLQCSLGAPAIQAPSNSWTMHRSHIPDRQQRHKRSPTKDRDRWQNQLWHMKPVNSNSFQSSLFLTVWHILMKCTIKLFRPRETPACVQQTLGRTSRIHK